MGYASRNLAYMCVLAHTTHIHLKKSAYSISKTARALFWRPRRGRKLSNVFIWLVAYPYLWNFFCLVPFIIINNLCAHDDTARALLLAIFQRGTSHHRALFDSRSCSVSIFINLFFFFCSFTSINNFRIHNDAARALLLTVFYWCAFCPFGFQEFLRQFSESSFILFRSKKPLIWTLV